MESSVNECKVSIRPVRDVIDIVGGKWKLPILVSLSFEDCRFNELERRIQGITPRMLSKELKELEASGIIKREEFNTVPVSVVYSLTKDGKSLDHVIEVMRNWGTEFRQKLYNK